MTGATDLGLGDAKINLASDAAKCAEVPFSHQAKYMFEEVESRFKHERKRREDLEVRLSQLEQTVSRFQNIFSAIVQDEVLRTFRENLNQNQGRCAALEKDRY